MSSESDSVRPELQAFRDLEQLVRHLGDELAAFRRRSLAAEARVRELEAALPEGGADSIRLKSENAELARRLESATDRTRHLLDRMRFVRQQHAKGGER